MHHIAFASLKHVQVAPCFMVMLILQWASGMVELRQEPSSVHALVAHPY